MKVYPVLYPSLQRKNLPKQTNKQAKIVNKTEIPTNPTCTIPHLLKDIYNYELLICEERIPFPPTKLTHRIF